MSKIDNETVESLSDLARINVSPEQTARLKGDLEKILHFIDSLAEVNTDGVPPTYHVSSDLVNVTRPDDQQGLEVTKEEIFDRTTFLSLAPEQVAGMVKVRSFMGGKDE